MVIIQILTNSAIIIIIFGKLIVNSRKAIAIFTPAFNLLTKTFKNQNSFQLAPNVRKFKLTDC